MKVFTATRQLNLGAGVLLGILGLVALGITFWVTSRAATAEKIILPPPTVDVAACKAIAPKHGLVEHAPPTLAKGIKAPWSPDGIHFVQSRLEDAKEQILNATAFQARCNMEMNYFCMGSACAQQGGNYMRLVLVPKVTLGADTAVKK